VGVTAFPALPHAFFRDRAATTCCDRLAAIHSVLCLALFLLHSSASHLTSPIPSPHLLPPRASRLYAAACHLLPPLPPLPRMLHASLYCRLPPASPLRLTPFTHLFITPLRRRLRLHALPHRLNATGCRSAVRACRCVRAAAIFSPYYPHYTRTGSRWAITRRYIQPNIVTMPPLRTTALSCFTI